MLLIGVFRRVFVHRTDLLRVMHKTALDIGVRMLSGTTFESIQETSDSVKLELKDGEIIEADVVIGADGIKPTINYLNSVSLTIVTRYPFKNPGTSHFWKGCQTTTHWPLHVSRRRPARKDGKAQSQRGAL